VQDMKDRRRSELLITIEYYDALKTNANEQHYSII
jgi:hypothetical protein